LSEFDPAIHHRRSIRLKAYDYAQAGMYFVTINSHQRQCIFGTLEDESIVLNDLGSIVMSCWREIPRHYSGVELDAFVVMPNHVHGILLISDQAASARWATHASPVRTDEHPSGPKPRSLGSIIGQFKSASTRQINLARETASHPVWHRNYYERVIRNNAELANFRDYIDTNPQSWLEKQVRRSE
jgi:putative transposase